MSRQQKQSVRSAAATSTQFHPAQALIRAVKPVSARLPHAPKIYSIHRNRFGPGM